MSADFIQSAHWEQLKQKVRTIKQQTIKQLTIKQLKGRG